ncbi:WG containing repeat-containing protein [Flexibacter flexilis DSM 6793]|uniref:WG containing repeat-containing protein n=1 Tax=Flexibacter flexilis DSM 6793 TaxID=927664 RepID=A0A1I1NE65_9BACT|nr:NlpC/P60 family protein [Flexibacter flexilis]SFC92020.1 WG containing repeat-containing protein [Flexibacter flexilis DSM 6793]
MKKIFALILAITACFSVNTLAQKLMPCQSNGLWGYCDASGKNIIPTRYAKALPFDGKLAAVVKEGNWFFINKKGKELINTNYYYDETDSSAAVPVFEKGLFSVQYYHPIHGAVVEYYNKSGKIVKPVDGFENMTTDTIPYTIFEADKAIAYGKTKLGTRYGQDGLDCSGFMRFVFSNYGFTLPFFSHEQALLGEEVSVSDARKGDLIFFMPYQTTPRKVGHVGMIISEKGQPIRFLHAAVSKGVTINNLSDAYYQQRFMTIRRVVQND